MLAVQCCLSWSILNSSLSATSSTLTIWSLRTVWPPSNDQYKNPHHRFYIYVSYTAPFQSLRIKLQPSSSTLTILPQRSDPLTNEQWSNLLQKFYIHVCCAMLFQRVNIELQPSGYRHDNNRLATENRSNLCKNPHHRLCIYEIYTAPFQ